VAERRPVVDRPSPPDPDEMAAFVSAASAWLEAHAPAKGSPQDKTAGRDREFVDGCRWWQRQLHDGGWAGISWPVEFGGQGRSVLCELAFARLQARYGVSTAAFDVGIGMVGPTLMVHGTPEQQARHLPALLRGDEVWSQMFSEPDAGSDLASLRTEARPDGDGWRVHGQKVWTSYARFADHAILLARSDPDRPLHRGITCFLVDMDSPGIEVRPIRQMNGMAEFNQLFLTDVPVAGDAVLGEVNGGWAVANTMLGSERGLIGTEWPGSDDLRGLAAARHRTGEPLVRQRLAEVYVREELLRYFDLRVQDLLAAGRPLGGLASVVSLFFADHLRRSAEVGTWLSGPEVLVADDPLTPAGRWQFHFLTAPSVRIASGTDEIQRNIIAERALGLPKDPRPA